MKKGFLLGPMAAVIVLALVAVPVLAATTFWTGTPSPTLSPVFGTLVDFDDKATGTVVNSSDYVSVGVASITETELGGTLSRYTGTQSSPNYVGTGVGCERGTDNAAGWDGTILIELANAVDKIGIGIADSHGIDIVTIMDPVGNTLNSQTAPAGINTYCGFDSDTANIKYLEIYGDFVAIDDLQFHHPVTVEKEFLDSYNVDDAADTVINVGEKWNFLMEITVTNDSDGELTDLLVKDNFGGDLELLEIGGEEVDQPTNKKDKWTGSDGAAGVTVMWTGRTLKAHMDWAIASIADGGTTTLTVLVSTDINPGQSKDKDKGTSGKNEYTEDGEHCLNSGPTVYVVISDYEVSYTDFNEICVDVEPAIE